MKLPSYHIADNGDAALTILFDAEISDELSRLIIQVADDIKDLLGNVLLETVPAYQSLTFCYRALKISEQEVKELINNILSKNISLKEYQSALVEIPVCYNNQFAPDMQVIEKHSGLKKEQIIQKHSEAHYLVHMLGFLPGFLYLGGLPVELHCPRKSVPALRVPAGAVGIGGKQTGIYPLESPGGWQIIGRTPLRLFKPRSRNPFMASPLDKVKFVSIDEETFYQLQAVQ